MWADVARFRESGGMFADFAVSNNIAFPKNILLREIIFSKSPFSTMIRMPYETLGILFWAIAESLTNGSNQQVIFSHTNKNTYNSLSMSYLRT